MKRGKSIEDFVKRLYEMTGHTVSDDQLAITLLSEVPDEYDTTVQVLSVSTDALTIDAVLPAMQAMEQRLKEREKLKTGSFAMMAGVAKESSKFQGRCFTCGKRGHLARKCPKKV